MVSLIAGTTGSVTGILKDTSGMPVSGGKVTLVDLARGKSVVTTADRKGSWVFPVVLPGTYKLHAEAKGFAPQDHPPVAIHVDSMLKIDLTLEAEKAPQ